MFSLKDKTVRVGIKIAIVALVFILLHFVARRVVFRPLEESREHSEQMHERLKASEQLIREYPNPKKKIEEIVEKMVELQKKSVSGKELPRVIQQLTKKSSELDIDIISIKPMEQVSFEERSLPQGVSKAYIEVVVKAPYTVLGEYFKALKELSIVFTIEALAIEKFEELESELHKRKEEESEGKLVATMLISSYTVWRL